MGRKEGINRRETRFTTPPRMTAHREILFLLRLMRRFSRLRKKRRNASYKKKRKIKALKFGRKTVLPVRAASVRSVRPTLNPQLLPLTLRFSRRSMFRRPPVSLSPSRDLKTRKTATNSLKRNVRCSLSSRC